MKELKNLINILIKVKHLTTCLQTFCSFYIELIVKEVKLSLYIIAQKNVAPKKEKQMNEMSKDIIKNKSCVSSKTITGFVHQISFHLA